MTLEITEDGRAKVRTPEFAGQLHALVAEMAASGADDAKCTAVGWELIWWTLVGEPSGHQPDAVQSLPHHIDEVNGIADKLGLDAMVRREMLRRALERTLRKDRPQRSMEIDGRGSLPVRYADTPMEITVAGREMASGKEFAVGFRCAIAQQLKLTPEISNHDLHAIGYQSIALALCGFGGELGAVVTLPGNEAMSEFVLGHLDELDAIAEHIHARWLLEDADGRVN